MQFIDPKERNPLLKDPNLFFHFFRAQLFVGILWDTSDNRLFFVADRRRSEHHEDHTGDGGEHRSRIHNQVFQRVVMNICDFNVLTGVKP
jgi:hypothetical protein